MEQANCRPVRRDGEVFYKTDLFFPERGESQRPGKDICAPCPVQTECLQYRRQTGSTHGMWGGRMVQRSSR